MRLEAEGVARKFADDLETRAYVSFPVPRAILRLPCCIRDDLRANCFQAVAEAAGSFLMLNVRLVPLASVVTPHSASAISIVAFWCVTKMNCVP